MSNYLQKLPVSCQITIKEPATILGFLENSAANLFFHPEIIATTLASLARVLGFKAQ